MWESCFKAIRVCAFSRAGARARDGAERRARGFPRGALGFAEWPLLTVIVGLAFIFSLSTQVALPVSAYANVSFSFKATTGDDNESGTRVLKIKVDKDTVSFGDEGVPLGELRESPGAAEKAEKAETIKKITKRNISPTGKIEKNKQGTISIEIGDEYYDEGKDIVRFGESIEIERDEVIEGDVVSIGGSVIVHGTVQGDVVSVGGTLKVDSTGVIEGDAVSVGGRVEEEPGSTIGGDVVSMGNFTFPGWALRGGLPAYGLRFAGLALHFVKALIVILLCWLISVVFADRVRLTADIASSRPLASFGIGLLVFLLLPVSIVLLCITIIGIPVAILLPVALVLVGLFGYTAVGLALGRKFFTGTLGSIAKAAVLGVVLIEAIPLIGKLLCIPGGAFCLISLPIRIVGYAIMACAVAMGLGASLLSKMGQPPKPAVAVPIAGAPAVSTGITPTPPAPPTAGT